MAFVTLNTGDEIALGAGSHIVDGTGKVTFTSVNIQAVYAGSGGAVDTVGLAGSTTDYTIRKDGTQLVLTHVVNGKTVVIASGMTADTLLFSDGSLQLQYVSGVGVKLGSQIVTTTAASIGVISTGTGTGTGTTTTNFHSSVTGVDSASLLTTQSSIVKALNGGEKWSSTSLTYSFDTTRPADYTGVQANSTASGNLTTGWQAMTATLSTLSSEILSSIDKLVQLSFTQVSANGDIRFSQVPTSGSVAAFAYFPGTTPSYSGDVFIDTGIDSTTLGAGRYGQLTITHELGHALGLKHPFEDGATLPTADDNHINTLMSYTDYQNLVPVFTTSGSSANVDYQQLYPDRFMVYDIAALQAIYGTDTTTATSSNTYQYGTNPFYATLWDAGGTDTLDLSTTTASDTVDLTPGHYSSINTRSVSTQAQEQKQTFASQGKTGFDSWIDSAYAQQSSKIYTGTHNLGIAYGAIIENVITGSAADTVTDNKVDNNIKTGIGNDLIYLGAGGHDTIDGGAGTDSVSLALTKSQVTYTSEAGGLIRLVGTTFAADLYNVEKLVFTDQTVTLA